MKNRTKISKNAREHYRKGCWSVVALCVVGLLAAIPPRGVLAGQTALVLDTSFSIGPISTQLNITRPVAQPAGVFSSTLHLHARDDTQTPPFNGDLVATGQAADADTLLGGFLPAALIVKQDLLAGMTFEEAAADAQAKTGVTVTFFNDATILEYGIMVGVIAAAILTTVFSVAPTLGDQLCTIKTKLATGLAALGAGRLPNPCGARATAP